MTSGADEAGPAVCASGILERREKFVEIHGVVPKSQGAVLKGRGWWPVCNAFACCHSSNIKYSIVQESFIVTIE